MVFNDRVHYYVREASHYYGMWRANMSNVLLSFTYLKAMTRAAVRAKSAFATHTAAEDAPEDSIQAQPPMPEPQPESAWDGSAHCMRMSQVSSVWFT